STGIGIPSSLVRVHSALQKVVPIGAFMPASGRRRLRRAVGRQRPGCRTRHTWPGRREEPDRTEQNGVARVGAVSCGPIGTKINSTKINSLMHVHRTATEAGPV